MQGDCPDHEPGCDIEANEEAKEHWKALMKQGPHLVTIQMANIAAFGKLFTSVLSVFFKDLLGNKMSKGIPVFSRILILMFFNSRPFF